MANVILTLTIMPDSPEADLAAIEAQARKAIAAFAGRGECRAEQKPVAFGLRSVNLMFVLDEAKGGTEELEKQIAALPQVSSVEVTDVRRAIG